MIFNTFTHKQVKYIAIPKDAGRVHIVTQAGQNMGAFYSVESFKKMYDKGECSVLGMATLSVRPI